MISKDIAGDTVPGPTLSRNQVARLLADTAHAVRVMKASWLRVALNLRQIRAHELWRHASPPATSFEDYAFGMLKLNRQVARRMLLAVDYTEEQRPDLIASFERDGDDVEVPALDVIHQLRRVEGAFKDRPDDFGELRQMVFDDGVGRVVLQRQIDEKLGRMATGGAAAPAPEEPPALESVLRDLMALEKRLVELKVSKEARKLAFQLVETLERECRGRAGKAADEGSGDARGGS